MIQTLLAIVHSFFYVHIRFRTLRKDLRPKWKNYYDISNVPTTLYLSQMKSISDSHYFLHLFTNLRLQHLRLIALSLCKSKLVFCLVLQRVYVRRIYSLIAKKFKFVCKNRSRENEERLVNQQTIPLSIFAGTATWKLTNTRAVIFSYFCRSRWFIFTKQIIIVLFWVIIYSYLQKFFKVGALKSFAKFTWKHLCWSLFLISQ